MLAMLAFRTEALWRSGPVPGAALSRWLFLREGLTLPGRVCYSVLGSSSCD